MNQRTSAWIAVALVPLLCGLSLADTRSDFLKLIDRPKVPLAPELGDAPATANAPRHFSFAADAQQRVPGIVLGTSNTRRPAVILLHGTGGTKNDELPMMKQLVAKGFITFAIDGRYHGERTKAGKGSVEYLEAITRAWKDTSKAQEHPFFFDTVWDVMRLVDYLETRDDVDAKRIGLIGVSKGGIETYLTAAVDPRITAAVPCIGVESFQYATENNIWQSRVGTIQASFESAAKDVGAKPDAVFLKTFYDKVAPGIYGEFDGPAMLPLIAPRPLLTINGDSDDRTPLQGLNFCTDAAQTAYHAAGADDHFLVRIQEKTGHKVNADSEQVAIDWFVKWLKP